MGKAACAFKSVRGYSACGSGAAVRSTNPVIPAQCFLKKPDWNQLQPPPFASRTNQWGNHAVR